MSVRLLMCLFVVAIGSGCTDEVPRCFSCIGPLPILSGHIRGNFAGVSGFDAPTSEGYADVRSGGARIEVWADGDRGEHVAHVLELWSWSGEVLVAGVSDELEGSGDPDRAPFLTGSWLDATFTASSGTTARGRFEEEEYPQHLSVAIAEGDWPSTVRVDWIARFDEDREATGTATIDTYGLE